MRTSCLLLVVLLASFACSTPNEQELKTKELLIGTWKMDTSYFVLGQDSLSFPMIPPILDIKEDTLDSWNFLHFTRTDSMVSIRFPSGSSISEYYDIGENQLKFNYKSYMIVDLNDSILTLKESSTEMVDFMKEYSRVDEKVATKEYYMQAMQEKFKLQKIRRDSIIESFNNMPNPDIVASFPGGMGNFYQLLSQNIVYPEFERSAGIQGRVVINFVVQKDGTMTDLFVLESVSEGCDDSALSAFKKIAKDHRWQPATVNGIPVRQAITLPINFTLKD